MILVGADTEAAAGDVTAVLRTALEVTITTNWGLCTDQRGAVLTAHPASPLASAQHRHSPCKHRCCSEWPGKNIPAGNYTGAAKLLLGSLL